MLGTTNSQRHHRLRIFRQIKRAINIIGILSAIICPILTVYVGYVNHIISKKAESIEELRVCLTNPSQCKNGVFAKDSLSNPELMLEPEVGLVKISNDCEECPTVKVFVDKEYIDTLAPYTSSNWHNLLFKRLSVGKHPIYTRIQDSDTNYSVGTIDVVHGMNLFSIEPHFPYCKANLKLIPPPELYMYDRVIVKIDDSVYGVLDNNYFFYHKNESLIYELTPSKHKLEFTFFYPTDDKSIFSDSDMKSNDTGMVVSYLSNYDRNSGEEKSYLLTVAYFENSSKSSQQ